MITLKLNSYTPDEVSKLVELLETLQPLLNSYCKLHRCEVCPVRHICYDVNNAISYAEDTAKERKNIGM